MDKAFNFASVIMLKNIHFFNYKYYDYQKKFH